MTSTPAAPPADGTVRWFAGYFGLQAVAGVAFWALVAWIGPVNELFQMSKAQHAVTNSFLFADLIIGIAGSAVAAIGLWRARQWGGALALFVAGGMVYATVYLVGWVAFTGDGGALLALMIPPSSLSAWCAVSGWRLTR